MCLKLCCGFAWQGFGSRGGCRSGFSEKLPEASPVSDGASASWLQDRPTTGQSHQRQWSHLGDNIVKKGKNLLWGSSRLCERNNSVDTKVSEEGGGGGASGTQAESPLKPMVKTMLKQAVPLQPVEVHCGADIHLQPMEGPMEEQVDAEGGCDPMGSCASAGSCHELQTRGERSPCWRRFAGRACDSARGPHCSSLLLKDSHWRSSCLPWEGPHAGAGEE